MTSNNSSTKTARKQGTFLMHSLRSYWWIAVICSVVYGFAGPVFTMLKLDSVTSVSNVSTFTTEELLLETQMNQMVRWFRAEGFIPLYFSAIVLAAVIGCVMFFYLQQKKQVNFYHSQPITRTRLFMNQYIVGLLLNVVPLLVMMAVSFLLVAAYRMGAIIDIGVILQHTGYILLLILASYSIAVFSGQLAGTMMTQMAVNTVLHFGVPVAAWVVNMLCNLFFATYNGQPSLIEASLKFSPVCAAFQYIDSISHATGLPVMTAEPMEGGMLAVLLGMTIGLSALAWVLYQKRPSEATGKALVYPVSEPILKAYLMFVVAITAGLIFVAVGNKIFFYFAVVSFAILTHMTCEVIIQHDFKAMAKRMPQCAVILVLILVIVSVFRFDLLGYESYLPEPEKMQRVSLTVSGAEDISFYGNEGNYSADAAVKQGVYDLLYPIVTGQQYRTSDFDGNHSPYDTGYEETTSITVRYQMNSGKTVNRIYRAVPASAIEEAYQNLYNRQAYREAVYADVLTAAPETIYNMTVDDTMIYNQDQDAERRVVETVAVAYEGEIAVTTVPMAETIKVEKESSYATMAAILEAYKLDVKDRRFDSLKKARQYGVHIQLKRQGLSNSYYYFDMPVYEDDKRTMAILSQLDIEENDRNYSDALIFRCDPSSEALLRKMLDVAYLNLEAQSQKEIDNLTIERCVEMLSNQAELTGQITGVDNVNQFIQQTELMNGGGIFVEYDNSHFVLLRYNHTGSNDWNNQLLYKGTLPEQYQ